MSATFLWQHMNKALIHKWNKNPSDDTLTIIDSLENTSEMNDLDRVFQIEGRVYIKILGHIIMWEQTSFFGRYEFGYKSLTLI